MEFIEINSKFEELIKIFGYKKETNVLDLDSIELVTLIMQMEESFNIELPLESLNIDKLNNVHYLKKTVINLTKSSTAKHDGSTTI